ncbi:MAG: NAD(P)/FAD-dependent oxidoreductase [Anderseniella sp.]|nr:NAD(P)/FAD-dependent oxidoreductase [Anderseniella sp.]
MNIDTLIVGAGAAGMMCAAQAASRGGGVVVIDHNANPGEKIRISGGGRCNFTNLECRPERFISNNPQFARSALSRYTQHDFVKLVERHGIAYHEKIPKRADPDGKPVPTFPGTASGQLFCDDSAKQIIQMLLDEMRRAGAQLWLEASVLDIRKVDAGFEVDVEQAGRRKTVAPRNLVIACGGKSIPKMGATGFGYRVAEQFGLKVTDTRAGLVPLVFGDDVKARLSPLAGLAAEAVVSCGKTRFEEAVLFTHRGLSGPAVLQVSSYWREREPVSVDLLPGGDADTIIAGLRQREGRRQAQVALGEVLPKRLADLVADEAGVARVNMADLSKPQLAALSRTLKQWQLWPVGTEGYRTAEVTVGGVDTGALDQKTMQARQVPGLYFIGEVVDVTGWLGGYNFQWAWSSGWVCGQSIAEQDS